VRGPFICGSDSWFSRIARHIRRAGWTFKEASTPARAEAVSVYYPFPLLELVEIAETDEHAETGEVLLYFLDSDGCQVTIRLAEYALEQLRAKLSAPLTK
jgi:hypothetical protein